MGSRSRRGWRQEKESGTHFVQLFLHVPAPLLQGVIAALLGRALTTLDKGVPRNSNVVTALPSACAACGHKHVLSWLAYAELHVAETLQGP